MKISVLASGSKGNSTYIEKGDTKILIDIGVSCSYIEKNLKELNVKAKDIDAIFITHTHLDHISGLEVFCKKYNPKIFISPNMEESIKSNNIEFINKEFDFKNLNIKVIKTSHDIESYGYIIDDEIVYITDTGYLNVKYFDILKNKTIYMIESNYDNEMLIEGSYPQHLKQRIWSDKGHISNNDCAYYLSVLIDEKTKYVFLMHLSEENNSKEKVLENYNKVNYELIITKQNERSKLVEI